LQLPSLGAGGAVEAERLACRADSSRHAYGLATLATFFSTQFFSSVLFFDQDEARQYRRDVCIAAGNRS
jgi:hypothetical protein